MGVLGEEVGHSVHQVLYSTYIPVYTYLSNWEYWVRMLATLFTRHSTVLYVPVYNYLSKWEYWVRKLATLFTRHSWLLM